MRTELDINVSYDLKRRKPSRADVAMKLYSQDQRNLIRDIGGLPGKTLLNVKDSFSRDTNKDKNTEH